MKVSNSLRSEVVDGLDQVGALLQSLNNHSTIKGVTGTNIDRMQNTAATIRKRLDEQTLTVAVMALMKSGKLHSKMFWYVNICEWCSG